MKVNSYIDNSENCQHFFDNKKVVKRFVKSFVTKKTIFTSYENAIKIVLIEVTDFDCEIKQSDRLLSKIVSIYRNTHV